MNDAVTPQDLHEADVLLYRGTSFISRAIQFFDGTYVSHAGLCLGDDSTGERQVGEAIAKGLVSRPLATSVHGSEWVEVRRLKNAPSTMQPVLDVAHTYIDQGNRYGYEQIVLLAFLCLTRKLEVTPVLRRLLRTVLDAAANALTSLTNGGKEPMICSEFVYRCYDEALPEPDDVYSLRINEALGAVPLRAVLPGTAAAAAGAPVTIRGQGVHPDSLLAMFSSGSGRSWTGTGTAPLALAGPSTREAEKPAPEGRVDDLIEQYLGEVRTTRTLAVRPDVALEDLREATDHFAAAFSGAVLPQALEQLAAAPPENTATAYSHLLTAAANFVTPGDLLKTQRLFTLGKLQV